MPQMIDEDGDIWEVDAAGNPIRIIGNANDAPKGTVLRKPETPDKPYRWQANDGSLMEIGPDGQPRRVFQDAPKPKEGSNGDPAQNDRNSAKSDQKLANLRALEQQIADVRAQYESGFKGGDIVDSILDYVPSQRTRAFNSAGAGLGDVGLAAFRTPGVGAQSDAELRAFIQANRPSSSDFDSEIEQKLTNLERRLNATYQEMGIAPPRVQLSPQARGLAAANQPAGPIATGAQADIPVPPAMLAELQGYLRARRGQGVDDQDFAAFYNDLARRNNYQGGTPESLKAYIRQFNETGVIGPVTPAKRETSGLQQLYNDVATTPWGTRTIRSANALAGGIPEMLGGNQARQGLSQLAEQNPMSAFIGDTAGAIAGTAGLVKGVNALGAPLSKALAAGNLGYGGIYGASQNPQNPLEGAAIGAMASGAGELAGGYVASPILEALGRNTLNPVLRLAGRPGFSEAPAISRPERTIINTVGDQGRAVTNLLGEASTLGVPMTLADTTEGLRSLGGAVARRSPQARAIARDVMEPRALGQIDRLQGAISRDFGDPTNVLERSDMLLKQAQANSRPLYNEAFQAPGASSVDAADILATPAGKTALARARTQMLNDRKDPSALGIDINDAGEPVLSSVPSFETLDYVKKGFDDIANEGRTPFGTFQPNADQAAAASLSSNLRSRIDAVNPAYAQARSAYAGPAAEREALKMGKAAIGQPAESISYTLKNMPAPRQEQYRLGALSGLSERANNARFSTNPFDVVAGSPEAQNRLRALFSENAARFIEQANLERQLAKSNSQIIGGSPTALNQQADQAFGLPTGATLAIDGASAMLTGAPPVATGARLLGGMSKDAFKLGLGKKRADELAPILFSPDAAAAAAAFRELQKNVRRKGVYEAAKKRRRGIFGSVGGGASAAAVSNEKQ